MSTTAKTSPKNVEDEHFEPEEHIKEYLQSLSPAQLRMMASYARKMAAGKEDSARKPGGEGGRWLEAQYVNGCGPYFQLRIYQPGDHTYTDNRGRMISGRRKTRYAGRRLSAELAKEFGYPEGATPEETDVNIFGTPRHSSSRKKGSFE